MRKVAIPTREGRVDDHFGHCAYYTIYTIEGKKIVDTQTMPSPEGCGCKSGIAADLEKMGVEVMLAGNMGDGAKNKLESHNIKVIRGCSGDINVVISAFLQGVVFDNGSACNHHECSEH